MTDFSFYRSLFSIITPAFLGRFLYFLYQRKQEQIIYNITYLITRHKSFLHRVIPILSLKIGLDFLSKNSGNVKIFWQKTDKNSYEELEKKNVGRLSAKVANNRFDRMHCDEWL